MNWLIVCIIFVCIRFQHINAKLTKASYFYNKDHPLVVAHRGSTGHFPEHSGPGYADAFYKGADFIELDIQITKDLYLVTNHDTYLSPTTDIEDYSDLYQDRKRIVKGYHGSHYFIDDFTLEEIKTLRRK